MRKTLFFCSRMEPFGHPELRRDLLHQFGGTNEGDNGYRLRVECQPLAGHVDARTFCARAIQECDGVVLLLDGSQPIARDKFDAPVLELEVMLTAACAKPVFIIDASEGTDPLMRLLGPEFFGGPAALEKKVVSLPRADVATKIVRLKEILAQTCEGLGAGAATLAEHVGWERLFVARPDRTDAFEEDGGNFPFAKGGLAIPDIDSTDIERILLRAEHLYKSDAMAALVAVWDAIRALSKQPWGSSRLDQNTALLWMRAWSIWSNTMAWLGLFGHSSGAAVTTNLAGLKISSRFEVSETLEGGPYAMHRFQGGLASTYFSLSKLVKAEPVQTAIRAKGISYATDALRHTRGAQVRAGLLAVRGPLFLSTGSPTGMARGFLDLHMSVQLNKKVCGNVAGRLALAASRVQLGAAHKELAKRTFRNPIFLGIARNQLETAYETLADAHSADLGANNGQLLMCMKHLVETRLYLGRESEAIDLWHKATDLADRTGIVDQLRQLQAIATTAGWINKQLP